MASAYAAPRPGHPGEPVDSLVELAGRGCPGRCNALRRRDRSVDVVTCSQAWHWTNPDRAVSELRRVVRPGGT